MEFISAPVGEKKTPVKVLSKQYKIRRRRRIFTGTFAALVLGSVLTSLVVGGPMPDRTIADADWSAVDADAESNPDAGHVASTEAAAQEEHPIYRHSVVPGGVRSPEEIENVIQRDPVVAAHYKDLNPQLMRNERLQKPLLAHVSYRLGDKVYWTKKPVLLPAGEPIMTDGSTTIRERCGNLISMDALAPASDEEPALSSFDQLVGPTQVAQRLDHAAPGVGSVEPAPMPASSASASGARPHSFPAFLAASGSPGTRSGDKAAATDPSSTRSTDPPAVTPPAVDPPSVDPPKAGPPAIDPPTIDPPKTDPPAINPPPSGPPPSDPPALFPPPFDPPTLFPPPVDPPLFGPPPFDPPTLFPPPIDPPAFDPNPPVITGIDPPLPVPEPGTLTMFGLAGAAGVAQYLRRRARSRVRK